MNDATKIYELYVESADANEQPQMRMDKYGSKEWWLHGRLHREDGAAVEYDDGAEEWWLLGRLYKNAAAWAEAVLKQKNKPHDEEAVQKFVRMILTKDDLL